MSTKKKILIFVLAVLLVLAVILCVACSAGGREQPEESTVPTQLVETPTEPEFTDSVATGPKEIEPPAETKPMVIEIADPPATEPLAKPVNSGTETSRDGGENQSGSDGQTDSQESKPDVPVVPVETVPPATQPPAIPMEPSVTEPVGCQHEWQSVYHPEEGHYGDYWLVCKCGYKCKTLDEMFSHQDSFLGGADLLDHINYGETRDYIVDSPEYYEWVCSKCGVTSDTQP